MAKRVEAVIVAKQKINHDCYIFSFEYLQEQIVFTIGQHFRIIKELPTLDYPEGEELSKKYTPINHSSQTNRIDFLVKIYRPNQNPNFPHGGRYTPYLQTQEVGDKLLIDGPYGKFHYQSGGNVTIHDEEIKVKRILFVAGGSGITPIFQTLAEIADMKDDQTELILIYANKTEEDIVLRKELEVRGQRVKIHYILSNPSNSWPYFKGYLSHELLLQLCPLDDPNTLYVHCGPPPMNKLIRNIFQTHYPNSRLFKF